MVSQIARTLVAIATYNEIENLPRLVEDIFRFAPHVDVLIIDDNSPDGSGRWCDQYAKKDSRVHCLHRAAKVGLGTATIAGFHYALEHDYQWVLTMDGDFSHHPRYLPALLEGMQSPGDRQVDVCVGSRYIACGGIEGWPLYRRVMSRMLNWYARLLLDLKVKDCSGAFRCYRTEALRQLDLRLIRSHGYSYLEEILWLLRRQSAGFAETPIVFVDRQFGQTKINTREAITAVGVITRLGLRHWLGL